MSNHNKTVIIIAGPTASGKTALAIQLASHYKTEIISADSRQCFKELNIGVAKPEPAELLQVKHHFIDSHSIHENVNARSFEQYALQAADQIFKNNDVAIMAGGTGLYIKAFCEGLDIIPAIDADVRKMIIENYELHGLAWLQQEVKKYDPVFWDIAEQKNPHRLMRALEVFISTGKSITSFRRKKPEERPFTIIKIALNISKEQLHKNIEHRVDAMIRNGLAEEVFSLLPFKNFNALQTVGYKEIFEYFDDKISLKAAVSNIKANTRQYAKRQMTWFLNDRNIKWLAPYNPADLPVIISSFCAK
ncbi:MAG TPA: tRNA (adenosine(37)-N6)-dimethylallyltransferase MiaA [Panacibacter sp.]|nr:tRNA (adenosine(37)-N6)-dimethylallyltransferase MiaA [Panacibacter sp.]